MVVEERAQGRRLVCSHGTLGSFGLLHAPTLVAGVPGLIRVVAHHRPISSPPIRMMKPVTTTMKKIRTNRVPLATAVRAPT